MIIQQKYICQNYKNYNYVRRSSMVVIDFDFRAGGQGSIPT